MHLELKPKKRKRTTISLAVTHDQKDRLRTLTTHLDSLELEKTFGDLHREMLDELMDQVEEFLVNNYGFKAS